MECKKHYAACGSRTQDLFSWCNENAIAALILLVHRLSITQNPKSKAGIIQSTRGKHFLKFVMLLINDTTYLLDEGTRLG